MKTTNNGAQPHIHLRRLYHWLGRDIPKSGISSSERTSRYVHVLRQALDHGLWMLPRTSESLATYARPASICFTENRLSESMPHATKFGRLGLGFTKKYVLDLGGHPVLYVDVKRRRKTPVLKALDAVRARLGGSDTDLETLAYFMKPIFPAPAVKNGGALKRAGKTTLLPTPRAPVEAFARPFGPTFVNQGEAEWRVIDVGQKRVVAPSSLVTKSDGSMAPDDLRILRFEVGTELTSIIFPDTRTFAAAYSDRVIRQRLDAAKVPVCLFLLEELAQM